MKKRQTKSYQTHKILSINCYAVKNLTFLFKTLWPQSAKDKLEGNECHSLYEMLGERLLNQLEYFQNSLEMTHLVNLLLSLRMISDMGFVH